MKCKDISEAHEMSAMVFGMERTFHFKGDMSRETDSMNSGVYEEEAMNFVLKPRVRTYREKAGNSPIRDNRSEKEAMRSEMLVRLREDMQKAAKLEKNGCIDFAELPVIEPRVREILLKWLSNAMEDGSFSAKTEDGRQYVLDLSQKNKKCVVRCEDGNLTMPAIRIVFQEGTED